MKHVLLFTACCLLSACLYAQSIETQFRTIVDSCYREKPNSVGIMIHVESPDQNISWSYAVGYAEKRSKKKIAPGQPALIASNTKTYVSAATLKLIESNKIHLEQSVYGLINKKTQEELMAKGYKLQDITIRHLLSHTSGIRDYVNDDYFDFVNTHRNYKWTRDEQIGRALKIAGPLSTPGDSFNYADINYLLLGEIIENCTKKPFYVSVSDLINFKALNINSTWFAQLQKAPQKSIPLVHQYWNKYPWDSYDLDPSWDLYGGGGIVSTTKDLALFFQRLFEGKIIKDPKVLAYMFTDVPSGTKTNYCLGIRKLSMDGLTGYYHGGFWGTDAIYFPKLNSTITIFILEKSERNISATICKEIASLLKNGPAK